MAPQAGKSDKNSGQDHSHLLALVSRWLDNSKKQDIKKHKSSEQKRDSKRIS